MHDFEKKKASYYEGMKLPWMGILYEEAELQLLEHLPEEPGTALVVGCGFGIMDRWLALQGWQVTGVDVTAGYLEMAEQDAAAEGLAIRYELMDAESGDWGALGGPFDLVLCHNVLDYLEAPETVIAKIGAVTKRGGLVSIVHHNPTAKVLKALIVQNDPVQALENMTKTRFYAETIGAHTKALKPETVATGLREAGCEIAGHYGIRTLYDLVSNEKKFEADWHQQMLELEKAVWDQSPYRDMAMLNHFVARKK